MLNREGMNTQQQMDHSSPNQTSEMLETTIAVAELRAERMQVRPSETLETLVE